MQNPKNQMVSRPTCQETPSKSKFRDCCNPNEEHLVFPCSGGVESLQPQVAVVLELSRAGVSGKAKLKGGKTSGVSKFLVEQTSRSVVDSPCQRAGSILGRPQPVETWGSWPVSAAGRVLRGRLVGTFWGWDASLWILVGICECLL